MCADEVEAILHHVASHGNDIAMLAVDHHELPGASALVEGENPGLLVVVTKTKVFPERAAACDGGYARGSDPFARRRARRLPTSHLPAASKKGYRGQRGGITGDRRRPLDLDDRSDGSGDQCEQQGLRHELSDPGGLSNALAFTFLEIHRNRKNQREVLCELPGERIKLATKTVEALRCETSVMDYGVKRGLLFLFTHVYPWF